MIKSQIPERKHPTAMALGKELPLGSENANRRTILYLFDAAIAALILVLAYSFYATNPAAYFNSVVISYILRWLVMFVFIFFAEHHFQEQRVKDYEAYLERRRREQELDAAERAHKKGTTKSKK